MARRIQDSIDGSRWAAMASPGMMPRSVLWACGLWALSFTIADPDLWGHVRFGLDMLGQGRIVLEDTYSFSSDVPWVNHEWLAELIMAAAFTIGGPAGLGLLKVVLAIVTFAGVSVHLRAQRVRPAAADVLVVASLFGTLWLTMAVRPQNFSLCLFVATLMVLQRADDGRRRLLLVLPLIMAVWANLHGGWLVGLAVIGLWTAYRTGLPGQGSRTAWMAAGALCLCATLLTPHGPELWRFLWRTVGIGRPYIAEWQPLTSAGFADWLSWAIGAAVAAPVVAWTVRQRPHHAAILVLLMLLSLKVMRVVPFFVVTAVMLSPSVLQRWQGSRPRVAGAAPPGAAVLVMAVAVAAFGASVAASIPNIACPGLVGEFRPDQRAARFMRDAALAGRLLTFFDWGEYALWHLSPGLKVSIDGRRETVYSEGLIERHMEFYQAKPGWEHTLAELAPDYIWMPRTQAVTGHLPAAGWHTLFETERSVVFGRRAPAVTAVVPGAVQPCFPG